MRWRPARLKIRPMFWRKRPNRPANREKRPQTGLRTWLRANDLNKRTWISRPGHFSFIPDALYREVPDLSGYGDKLCRVIGAADPGAVPGGSTRKGFSHSEAPPDGAEPGSTCVERRYFRPARVSRKTVQNLQVPTITRLLLLLRN